jgi:sulfotransferase
LLSALLRQNPQFRAAMTSPVASLTGAMMQHMSSASEFATFFDDDRHRAIIEGVFESYYNDVPE